MCSSAIVLRYCSSKRFFLSISYRLPGSRTRRAEKRAALDGRTLSSRFFQASSRCCISSMQCCSVLRIPVVVALNVSASPLKSIEATTNPHSLQVSQMAAERRRTEAERYDTVIIVDCTDRMAALVPARVERVATDCRCRCRKRLLFVLVKLVRFHCNMFRE